MNASSTYLSSRVSSYMYHQPSAASGRRMYSRVSVLLKSIR